jgi:hypothetical protein
VDSYLIAFVGIVAVGVMAFLVRASASASVEAMRFTPNPSNDTQVFYSGCDEAEPAKVLKAFARVYKDELGGSGEFRTEKLGEEKIRITFPQDVSPDSLSFLVNYLQYPEDLDLSTHQLAVLGRVSLSADFPLPQVGSRVNHRLTQARSLEAEESREYSLADDGLKAAAQ